MHCCYADVIKKSHIWSNLLLGGPNIVHINPRLPHSYSDEVRFNCISAFTTNQLHLMNISEIVIVVSAAL